MNRAEVIATLRELNEGLREAYEQLEPMRLNPHAAQVRQDLREHGQTLHDLLVRLDAGEDLTDEVAGFGAQVQSHFSESEVESLRDLAEVAPTLIKLARAIDRLASLTAPVRESIKSQQRPAGARWFPSTSSTRRQPRPAGAPA